MDSMQTTHATYPNPCRVSDRGGHGLPGKDLAESAVDELIQELCRRAAAHQLDRGVRLSFPYYDDRRLSLRWRDFTVIPRGRILFVPAFVVVAAEREIERVRKDRQFTDSTRHHLVGLLERLRRAFARPDW